jgi:hypothetical protein
MALLIGACAEGDTDPASTMTAYVTAYNSGDIDEIMTFFSDESAITGHPYYVEATGLDGIRELHIVDRQEAAVEDPYMISNLEVADDTVTWNQIWVSNTGQEYCHEGQSAVVKDGTILFWDLSSGFHCG